MDELGRYGGKLPDPLRQRQASVRLGATHLQPLIEDTDRFPLSRIFLENDGQISGSSNV